MSPDLAVERLLQEQEIVRRKLAFARAADAGDADAMVAAFAEDVVATYVPGDPRVGRRAIRDWYAEVLVPVAASSHALSNFEVEWRGEDEAVLRCYLYSWQRFRPEAGREDRHRWARYVDTWRRDGDGWVLTSLTLLEAGETPAGDGARTGEYRTSY